MSKQATVPPSDTEAVLSDAVIARPPHKAVAAVLKVASKANQWMLSREPRLFPTIVMLVGAFILLGLGTWQIQRTNEKNALLNGMTQAFESAPINLTVAEPNDAEQWRQLHYKPVVIKGTWMSPAHIIKLAPRVFEETVGYQLLMPLRLANQQVVMVNLGFMPEKMASLPPENAAAIIHGVAYMPEATKPNYLPENVPSRGIWTWTDLAALGHEVGVDGIAPVIIYQDRVSDRDSYPIGGQLPLPSHNRHWHYAVTWYALALALMVIWMIASNPKPKIETPPTAANDSAKDLSDPVARRGMYPEATD